MKKPPRELLINSLFTMLSMYGGAWLGYLCRLVPLYIIRGTYGGEDRQFVERLVGALLGLAATALFLVLFHRRSDRAERLSPRRALAEAGIAAALYAAAQILFRLLAENTYLVAVHVTDLSALFGTAESARYPTEYPTLPASVIGAFISCTVYFLATALGMRLAVRRRKKRFH